ncbi:MAG: TadE/TadG family type IV pilus assembly protein [Pseudomonadota bacterium]
MSKHLIQRVNERAQRFAQDTSGAALVFGITMFLLIVIVGGLAVDLARMEAQRVKVQQTLDRAVLAAADLDNASDSKVVVRDYFAKAGLSSALVDVQAATRFNGKTVVAETEVDIATMFLRLVGVNSLNIPGSGAAQEQVSDIEISLVVDISGSMDWDNHDGTESKMDTLKTAAATFFDEVAADQSADKGVTMVSIIPYNASVNVGADLLGHFNATEWHTDSHCVRFYDDDFTTRAITPTQQIERLGHFADGRNNYNDPSDSHIQCDMDTDHEILAFETDILEMKAHINALDPAGATAIDNGMKWAAALLDPAVQPIVTQMITDEERSGLIAGWPTNYGTPNSMKVVVLMTDGENTVQSDLKSAVKSTDGVNPAMSNVYWSPKKGNRNWWNGWYVHFPNNHSSEEWYRPRSASDTDDDQWRKDSKVPNDLIRQSYQDLFRQFYVEDAAYYFYRYADPDGYWGWWSWVGDIPSEFYTIRDAVTDHDEDSEIDDRLKDICDAIKQKPVIVFSIAFEAEENGEDVMRYCASSDGHYYDVEGTDLNAAFKSIANQINHLRLISPEDADTTQ